MQTLDADTLARDLCATVSEIYALGLAPGTGGNFSVTLDRDPLRLLITQSGLHKGRLRPEKDLVTIGPDAKPTDGSTGRPSAETLLHVAIVEATGAGATLHTHSVANTLLSEHFLAMGGFSMTGYEMLKGLEGVRSHEETEWVPIVPNAQDMPALAEEVRALLDRTPRPHGFLLAGHGLYTWGEDLAQASRHVEIFEFLFDVLARRTRFTTFQG